MSEVTVFPDVAQLASEVSQVDYNRLLGLPRQRELEDALAERAAWARAWYARHARPYLRTRRHVIAELSADTVRLESGQCFASPALVVRLRQWNAHALVGMAATAGAEIDQACSEMWQDGRPDEAWFLERFGVAVVERLMFSATLGGCRQAALAGETLTAHLSPGCGSWDLGEQRALWEAIFPAGDLGPLRLLDSGGLTPKCSLLAAAGVTRQVVSATPTDACRACDLAACRFRRAAWKPGP